ncbi:Short-chain dehydrogenase/reductase tropE [Pseudocercospora fuligena]|uniref:Short-chain dehydrogenase/reductase tropE n=1 Tax=Pseudocercospora fuligena TaxID=685502 RepID=A0A8H6RU19_9PEZI|nr:Short-chain dehydrogenase/reductase tropE [Pseudocercospora fuligena]
MAASRIIVLVTGANGGIGFETVRQLAAQSKHVLLGSRSLEKGEQALKTLQAENHPGTIELLQIDVSRKDSIVAAAKHVTDSHGRLDALVNNAAVASFPEGTPTEEQMRQSFETNCIGPVLVVDEFAPLLKKSITTPRIVNVSSGAGSITRRLDQSPSAAKFKAVAYRSTKAALNMITAEQVVEFGDSGFKIFAYCPGFTVSNLSSMNTTATGAKPTSEGVRPLVDIINGKRDAEHTKFLNEKGEQYPW